MLLQGLSRLGKEINVTIHPHPASCRLGNGGNLARPQVEGLGKRNGAREEVREDRRVDVIDFGHDQRRALDLQAVGDRNGAALGPRGRILGASIVGANAGELIHLWALAVAKKMTVGDLRGFVPPYPTLGEVSKRAATSYYTPVARNPWIRRVIAFLRRFG